MEKKKGITPKNKAVRRTLRSAYTPMTMAEKEELVEIFKEAYFARIAKEAGHGQAEGDL